MADLVLDDTEPLNPTRRTFKVIFDPLVELSDQQLYERYRFDRNTIVWLSTLLEEDLIRTTERSEPIPVHIQVCIALRYLASNSYQQVIADTFGVCQPTVSNVVTGFLTAINQRLDTFIQYPRTDAEVQEAQHAFYNIAQFPEVVGCVDGTHIRIQAPREDEDDYINRKGFHSLNVMAICDHRYKFTFVCARWPGRAHDSYVLRSSSLFDAYQAGRLRGLLLGDSGYPCKPWLMVPFRNAAADTPQMRFNIAHRRTRVLIEQAFGQVKRRFGILHQEIRIAPEKATLIVGACFALHNLAKDRRLTDIGDDFVEEDLVDMPAPDAGIANQQATAYRDYIVNTMFN